MKWYHFGLIFLVIAVPFFLRAQIRLIIKMKEETERRMEYDCLMAAVNAAVEVAFTGAENKVTEAGLLQTEEVFFQTLSVLHDGIADEAGMAAFRNCVPCLVVFDEQGYYCYRYTGEQGYAWSAYGPYQDGEIPERFFSETEELLADYHRLHYTAKKRYRMEQAAKGIWEQSLSKACVFAIYAPPVTKSGKNEQGMLLYAAANRTREAYLVTEDNHCHLPSCEGVKNGTVIARYATQKKSAEDGAIPCPLCLQ